MTAPSGPAGGPAGFVVDSSWRRPTAGDAAGRVVIAGSPLRLFRFTAGGVRVVDAVERGAELPPGHGRLTDRLVEAGAIHPVLPPVPAEPELITVVVPARGEWPRFRGRRCRVIVVDDASPLPLLAPLDDPHAELVRLDRNLGPGGARTAGLALVTTPYVAFVDSDVDADEESLCRLAAHLADDRVALVAPRVVVDPDDGSALAVFERTRSPLDMGPEPARVAPGTRVGYVPAAAWVCRVAAIHSAGGFDPGLRYGEDVDLVWRLAAAGWRCRYEPAISLAHRSRADLQAWTQQRFRYGTSAGPLAVRHPDGALAPVRMSGWSAATWTAIALGHPLVGVGVGTATAAALVRKLPDVPAAESLRLAGLGHLWAGRQLAAALMRAWWPATCAAALVSRRARRVLVASLAVQLGTRGPSRRSIRCAALRVIDDAAYGAGVWTGAWRSRTWGPLVPRFTSWPGRQPGTPAAAATPGAAAPDGGWRSRLVRPGRRPVER